jgi:hypothetical protein
MREENATERVHEIGTSVQQSWEKLGADHGLVVTTGGLPALANFAIDGFDPLAIKTYITTRMLDQGYLASNSMYASIAHTPEILDAYYEKLGLVFGEIASLGNEGISEKLPHGTAQAGFKRLT